MALHADEERVASVPVEPGVFLLRYISSAAETPPRVFAEVSPASRAHVQIVFIPGKPSGVLEAPQQLALVVAERRGHLQLTVSPFAGGGASARVELEPLPHAVEAAPPAAEPAEITTDPLLTCHVAKRGDVTASGPGWICGPEAPAIIEGVQIDWSGVDPAALEYQALIQGAGVQWGPWVRAGEFIGSRGRGLPLMGFRLRLTAAAPANARLIGEAAFLGCPLVKEQGREIELVSYSGADPLVGLRLQWERVEPKAPEIVVGEAVQAQPDPIVAGTALKVFRSKRAGDRVVGLGG